MHVKRFFRHDLPTLNDLVMVKVIREEEEIGYYCELLEYENLEGFLPLSELVKKKYAKKHLLKPGQLLAMTINKVEQNTRLVNLTRKRVTDIEDDKTKELYRTCEDINRLVNEYYSMYLTYLKNDETKEVLDINKFMKQTIWNFYDVINDDYPKAYQYILQNPTCILSEFIFEHNFIVHVLEDVNKRITHTNKIVNIDINLVVPDENPVSKIKEIMDITDIQLNNPDYKIRALVMTSPHYRIKVDGPFNDENIINLIKDKIRDNSKKHKSTLEFSELKIEKESTCKLKYYSDHDLLKL